MTKKLTYWVALCTDDSEHYSIRAKTRHEVVDRMKKYNLDKGYNPPKKVTVEYQDSFDLLEQCLCESSNYWEHTKND